MSNEFVTMHQIAMEFVDEARLATQKGETKVARLFFQKAFALEKVVATATPQEDQYRLTRSVFLRSAATLAIDSRFYQEAIDLTNLALKTNPHPALRFEIEELAEIATTKQANQQKIKNIKGKLVAVDLPSLQIKVQVIDSQIFIPIRVSEQLLVEIVQQYWNKVIIVQGVTHSDGFTELKEIKHAA